jgi:hypothetical protein
MTLEALDRPIKFIFVLSNVLVWTAFCVRLAFRWHQIPTSSHSAGISLAVMFPLLWYSLLRENDRSSRFFYATGAFFATIFAVYPIF